MNGRGVAFPHLYLSVPGGENLPAARWADIIVRERALRTDAPGLSRPLRSVFVGGGTPEVLGSGLPEDVRQVTGPDALDGIAEWSVEISDPRIEEGVVSAWIEGGVTRLSLRGKAAAPGAVGRIAELSRGRTALGVDVPLAAGGLFDMEDRIAELIDLGAGSLALVDPEANADADAGIDAEVEGTREAWLAAVNAVHRAGWRFLDLAFAFGTSPCPVHPQAIVRRSPVLGLGPGAVTFRHPRRRWNHADSRSYVAAIRNRGDPVAGRETLTRTEGRFERCWTSLRSARGLRMPTPACGAATWFERWQGANWVQSGGERVEVPDRLRLSPEGWLRADGLAVELALELERIRPGGSTDHPEFQNFEE